MWGLTEGGRKTTGVDARVLPQTVVYDADADPALPVDLSVASRAQRAGALRGRDVGAAGRPDGRGAGAARAIRALRDGLPAVVDEPTGLDGREQTLYGAYLSAVAFASAGLGTASQDLPRPRRHVRPAARARPTPWCCRTCWRFNAPHAPEAERAHRRGVRRAERARRPAGTARGARRADARCVTIGMPRTVSPRPCEADRCGGARRATRPPSPPTPSPRFCAPPGREGLR